MSKEKLKKKTYSKQEWLSIEEFKSWLRPDSNSTQPFKCLACNRSYALSNKGSAVNGTHGYTKLPQHQENLSLKASKETQINFFKQKSQADQSTAANVSIPAN